MHFQPKLKIEKFSRFLPFLAIFGPFWALFGPPLGPQIASTGQNEPKGGQQAIKMCFGTVLDHLEATGPHLEAKKKIEKKNFFNIF